VKAPPRLFLLNSGKEFVGSLLYLFMKPEFDSLQDVPLDAPLRLGIAARLAYPDGSMTASGLRKEAGRGRLAIERVAGKDYTTLSAIAEMRKKCLLEPKGRGSGLGRNADQPVENSSPNRPGSFSAQHHQMPDTDALVERLFPVTASEILRDPAPLDFSFVMPSKVSQTMDILPNIHSDTSVSERFNVTLRTIRERARERNLGRKLGGTRWFTEAEIIGLMTCSSFQKDTVLNSGRRGAPTSESKLTEALELVTKGKLKPSSQRSKTKSSNGQVVAFQKK
jgi:hypothetical protein